MIKKIPIALLFILFIPSFSVAGEVANQSIDEMDVLKSIESGEEVETGGYVDSHGCVSTSGYEWAEVLGECIRIFEQGIGLKNIVEPNSNSVAYIVFDEESKNVELFYQYDSSTVMQLAADGVWLSDDTKHKLMLIDDYFSVFNSVGELLYKSTGLKDNWPISKGVNLKNDLSAQLADKEIRATGRLISIEEGAYPMFTVRIAFDERNSEMGFNLNIEALSMANSAIDTSVLYAMQDKHIAFHYSSDLALDLYEVKFLNQYLFGEEVDANWQSLTGILMGADHLSGDLPSKIHLVTAENKKVEFTTFVDEALVNLNKQEVTVYYGSRTYHQITYLTRVQ